MVFVRIKKINKNSNGKKRTYKYAYLVENKWKPKSKAQGPNKSEKGKVMQKVKKYLGRVYEFDKKDVMYEDFLDTDLMNYIDIKSPKEIVLDLVKWELVKHGFSVADGGKGNKDIYEKDDCIVNVGKQKVLNKRGADIALSFNEGILCTFSLKKLLKFKFEGEPEEIGYKVAKSMVELGIDTPKEAFVGIVQKII